MKKCFFLGCLFCFGLLFLNDAKGQMVEGRVFKYYVVVGSYNSMRYANVCIKKKEKEWKVNLFVLSIPNKKLYRVCYSQSKTKEEIMVMKEEAVNVFPEAWILYL